MACHGLMPMASNKPLLLLIWSCIGSLGMAVPLILQTFLITDSIEYAELETGKCSKGLLFSNMPFMVRLTGALSLQQPLQSFPCSFIL